VASATGLKRSPFSAGLSVNWRGPEFANRPTHDIHDVRAWGITDPKTGKPWSKGVGDAGHRFLDEQGQWVTDRANETSLGGLDDWTPYRAQAAAWVAQKAEKEGIPVSQASRHYGSFAPNAQALNTREWVPGDNTDHLPGLLNAPFETRKEYSDLMEEAVTGPQGIDSLARGLGALTDTTLPNLGVYEGATNPGFVTRVNVGRAPGSFDIDPASAKVMDGVSASHGIYGTQKQSAWNFGSGDKSTPDKDAGAVLLNMGRPATPEELASLGPRFAEMGADIPMADPRGARSLVFAEDAATRKGIMAGARKLGGEIGAEARPLVRSGNIFPVDENFNAPDKFSYLPYIEKVEAAGPQFVQNFDRTAQTVAPEILRRTEEWAQKSGDAQAPWFRTAMEILASKGLAGLKEAQRAGIVPVAFVAAVGSQLAPGLMDD
jgi:hypothetical protein